MTTVKCPSCGNDVEMPKPRPGFPWWAGCLIAVAVVPVILAVLGILAAIALPAFSGAKNAAQMNACVVRMKQIESVKQTLSYQGKELEESLVNEYLGDETAGMCPAGGEYTYNPVGTEPECSIHGTPSNPVRGRGQRSYRVLP